MPIPRHTEADGEQTPSSPSIPTPGRHTMAADGRPDQARTATGRRTPRWLADAVFYEIYPQTFADADGDGIGDLRGIIDHLDYIRDLGCDALWINPCFDSPFRDAGYDVRDYTRVAGRYGAECDLTDLFAAAHERGMHVLLDLVPGHTSEEHPWFRASAQADPAERVVDGVAVSERYIWTDSWIAGGDGLPFIAGEAERDGAYVINFFKCQPALNYGFAHPSQPWQHPALGPAAMATCDAIVDVMRFWLTRGADGFRVDMADSLVKHDDEGKPFTIRTWQYMFSKIRPEFPNAAFVSEWGRPHESLEAGFDMDFYLDWRWGGVPNGYNMLLRNTDTPLLHEGDASYFNVDSGTSIRPFLDQYLPQLRECEQLDGFFDLITCNHDTVRLAPRLTDRERRLAFGMLLTMPGCPFVYYGDEIGLAYRPLPTKEGGYVRTGSRTPMQWSADEPNLGFSTADPAALYLPVDDGAGTDGSHTSVAADAEAGGSHPSVDAGVDADAHPLVAADAGTAADTADPVPTAAAAMADPDSLWHWIRALIAVRRDHPALRADGRFDVLAAPADGRVFAYRRSVVADGGRMADTADASGTASDSADIVTPGGDIIVALNPGRSTQRVDLPEPDRDCMVLLECGDPMVVDYDVILPPQSFIVLAVR